MPEAKLRGYKPGRFSFNVKGGRCEACQGEGIIEIEMQFLPDVYVPCEVCHGTRYNRETLEIRYKGKNIADVLDMTVEEALEFFENIPRIKNKLQTLYDVGLGYIQLGQPATQLSGGEAQRVKLATELSAPRHRQDALHPRRADHRPALRRHRAPAGRAPAPDRRGQHVLVIEHNLDVIKTADWLIDLGPEGGDAAARSSPTARRRRSRRTSARTPARRCGSCVASCPSPPTKVTEGRERRPFRLRLGYGNAPARLLCFS